MISHVMDLTQSEKLGIIIYFEIDFSFIIYYLNYLTFSTNLHLNQLILNWL